MSKQPKERVDKYFICESCAKKKGWKLPGHAITVIHGLCGHCNRQDEATLIPEVDFIGPGKRAIWD